MSHMSQIACKIEDLNETTIEKTLKHFVEGATFTKHEGNFKIKGYSAGMNVDNPMGLGFAINIPGKRYEMAVVKTKEGVSYAYDAYSGEIEQTFGKNCTDFSQVYVATAVDEAARKQLFSVYMVDSFGKLVQKNTTSKFVKNKEGQITLKIRKY